MHTILLTSFTTWLPHQGSNSSEVLLREIERQDIERQGHQGNRRRYFLQGLPVNTRQAFRQVWDAVQQYRPDGVVCCGMAESRSQLELEWQAKGEGQRRRTGLDLDRLKAGLSPLGLSDDAGDFVCNDLYYGLLKGLATTSDPSLQGCQGLFIHVPPVTIGPEAWERTIVLFKTLLERLEQHP